MSSSYTTPPSVPSLLAEFNLNPQQLCATWGVTSYPALAAQTTLTSTSPAHNTTLGSVLCSSPAGYEQVVADAQKTFLSWRQRPAPFRGDIMRQIANKLREKKEALAALVTLEVGKIYREALGEVQEAIDIADFCCGLGRQLYGKHMHSERPSHRMLEQWHPLGIVGVITAFNYPVAVWAWNAFIAATCGDTVLWKPSPKTPLTSIALNTLCHEVAAANGYPGVFSLVLDHDGSLGKLLAADKRIPLVSATGSTAMGKAVGTTVAQRLGKSLLELGGNNAAIILKDADISMALASCVFGAAGTTGQRCTTTRRIFIAREIYQEFCSRMSAAYQQLKLGCPFDPATHVGPLVNAQAKQAFVTVLNTIKAQSGTILYGGTIPSLPSGLSDLYVTPTIVTADRPLPIMREEVFVPIVYLVPIDSAEQGIAYQNDCDHGLSSCMFTNSLHEAARFLSPVGSDCGIANVNTGTSQAEIGGAFGGEKDTGGGREAGSDCWQFYMRRQTCTVNFGHSIVLAQGLKF